ncbi:MAG: HypC/HybG/HupF family hydrogenase formation chaperone [bacterium]|nr:HypC/HybG/HupF family hydrogenase formation chaperone [bacterium]
MCISIPGKVILIKGENAKIKQKGHFHWVNISSLEDEIKKGDYLITYQGAAINKISPKDAKEILRLMDGTGDTGIKCSD